jgi:hypothetical protein
MRFLGKNGEEDGIGLWGYEAEKPLTALQLGGYARTLTWFRNAEGRAVFEGYELCADEREIWTLLFDWIYYQPENFQKRQLVPYFRFDCEPEMVGVRSPETDAWFTEMKELGVTNLCSLFLKEGQKGHFPH